MGRVCPTGELNFASTDPGSGSITIPGAIGAVEDLYPVENVMDNEVVYDGGVEAVQRILAGGAHILAGSYLSIVEYTQSEGLQMLLMGTTDEEPPEETPDAETFATSGMDGEKLQSIINSRRVFGVLRGGMRTELKRSEKRIQMLFKVKICSKKQKKLTDQ